MSVRLATVMAGEAASLSIEPKVLALEKKKNRRVVKRRGVDSSPFLLPFSSESSPCHGIVTKVWKAVVFYFDCEAISFLVSK